MAVICTLIPRVIAACSLVESYICNACLLGDCYYMKTTSSIAWSVPVCSVGCCKDGGVISNSKSKVGPVHN